VKLKLVLSSLLTFITFSVAFIPTHLASGSERLYFHHPPYSSVDFGPTLDMRWPYQEWGATASLAGHAHNYERLIISGFPYHQESE
jgi:hypothetical protein